MGHKTDGNLRKLERKLRCSSAKMLRACSDRNDSETFGWDEAEHLVQRRRNSRPFVGERSSDGPGDETMRKDVGSNILSAKRSW